MIDDNLCSIVVDNEVLFIKTLGHDLYEFSCDKKRFNKFYNDYFDLDMDYKKINRIVNKDDLFLKNCIKYGDGLRILKQDPFETVISFIISQRKSIPAIKTSIERICKLCGNKIDTEHGVFYSFPTPKALYDNRAKLGSCGLGYRKDYVINASKAVLFNELDLDKLYKLDNEELKERLLSLKGVGEKVATCIMLFAYSRYDVCPVDIWIQRVLNQKYKGAFPEHYKKYAGIIQQYWFYYAKEHKVF